MDYYWIIGILLLLLWCIKLGLALQMSMVLGLAVISNVLSENTSLPTAAANRS